MFRARYHNNVTTGKRDSTHCFIISVQPSTHKIFSTGVPSMK